MGLKQTLFEALDAFDAIELEDDSSLLKLRDYESLKEHSIRYDKILDSYSTHVEATLEFKRNMKQVFFWISVVVMSICVILVVSCAIVVALNAGSEGFDIQDYIIPSITAITSFLTVFIVIPKVIAEYLFDSSEDAIMKDIVANIQKHDEYIREHLESKK